MESDVVSSRVMNNAQTVKLFSAALSKMHIAQAWVAAEGNRLLLRCSPREVNKNPEIPRFVELSCDSETEIDHIQNLRFLRIGSDYVADAKTTEDTQEIVQIGVAPAFALPVKPWANKMRAVIGLRQRGQGGRSCGNLGGCRFLTAEQAKNWINAKAHLVEADEWSNNSISKATS